MIGQLKLWLSMAEIGKDEDVIWARLAPGEAKCWPLTVSDGVTGISCRRDFFLLLERRNVRRKLLSHQCPNPSLSCFRQGSNCRQTGSDQVACILRTGRCTVTRWDSHSVWMLEYWTFNLRAIISKYVFVVVLVLHIFKIINYLSTTTTDIFAVHSLLIAYHTQTVYCFYKSSALFLTSFAASIASVFSVFMVRCSK